jgi:toxin FitB
MSRLILDTNSFNEIYRTEPDAGFRAWFQRQPLEMLYTTAVNADEIWYGIECLPGGRKKADLARWWDSYFLPNFTGRILAFDLRAAKIHGTIRALGRRRGKPRPIADSMVAAIAVAHDAGIVTRNTIDFAGLDIDIVNPWL